MKKTIAVLLVFALVLVGVFAVDTTNVTLKGSVADGQVVVDPGADGNDPAGMAGGITVLASTNSDASAGGVLLKDIGTLFDTAKLSVADETSTVTAYYLHTLWKGNPQVSATATVTITAQPFSNDEVDDTLSVGVTGKGLQVTAEDKGKATATGVITSISDSSSQAVLSMTAPFSVATKAQPFASFTLSWTPAESLPAGTYTSTVTINTQAS